MFDGRCITARSSGVGRHASSLFSALIRTPDADMDILLLKTKETAQAFDVPVKDRLLAPFTLESHPLGDLWLQTVLPMKLRLNSIDVFHSPAFHLPLTGLGSKKITTLHDLAVFRFPETFPFKFSFYLRRIICAAVKSADAIIAVSRFTADEIMELFEIPAERIHVIQNAPDGIFSKYKDNKGSGELMRKHKLRQGYFLYVGNLEPRKNLDGLFKAFTALPSDVKKEHPLVIAGERAWLWKKTLSSVPDEYVHFTGYIEQEQLPALYSHAGCLVYPSIYEGFGLPILEAMACGCPVIASDIPSSRQTGRDAAKYVNPHDHRELAASMRFLIQNRQLQKEMQEKGSARASEFSWEESAAQTVQLYKATA